MGVGGGGGSVGEDRLGEKKMRRRQPSNKGRNFKLVR